MKSTLNYNADFSLQNCLFGAVKLTQNADVYKCKYFGYCTGFDGKGVFSHPTGSLGNNAIIFGVYMSSFIYIENKKRHFNSWRSSNTRIRRAFINCKKEMYSVNFSANIMEQTVICL